MAEPQGPVPFTPPGGTTVSEPAAPSPRLSRPEFAAKVRAKLTADGGADPYVHLSDDDLVNRVLRKYPAYEDTLRPSLQLPILPKQPRSLMLPPPGPTIGGAIGPPRVTPDPRTGQPVAEVRPGESIFDMTAGGLADAVDAAPGLMAPVHRKAFAPNWKPAPGTPPGFSQVRAANKVLGGTMEAAAGIVLPGALITNPLVTMVGVGVGTAATEAGRYITAELGAPEPIAELAGNVAGLAAGGIAAERVVTGQGQRARLAELRGVRAGRYTEGPPTQAGVRPPHRSIAIAAADAEADRISLGRAEAYATERASARLAETIAFESFRTRLESGMSPDEALAADMRGDPLPTPRLGLPAGQPTAETTGAIVAYPPGVEPPPARTLEVTRPSLAGPKVARLTKPVIAPKGPTTAIDDVSEALWSQLEGQPQGGPPRLDKLPWRMTPSVEAPPEQGGLNLKVSRQPGRVPTRPIQGVGAESIGQAPGGATSTLRGRRGQGRLRDLPETISARVPPEALDDETFMAAAGKAVEEGYTGSPGELHRRYLEEVEKAQVLNDLTEEHGPQNLLRDIAQAGGIGEDPQYAGEIRRLLEGRDQSARYNKYGRKMRETQAHGGTIGGVAHVTRKGGLMLDHLAEALRTGHGNKYAHILGPNELLAAVEDAQMRIRQGHGERIQPDFKYGWWKRSYEQDEAVRLAERLADEKAEDLSLSELEDAQQQYLQLFGPGGEGGVKLTPGGDWPTQEGLFGPPDQVANAPVGRLGPPEPAQSPEAIADRMREKLARGEPIGSPEARAAAEARGRVDAAKAANRPPSREEQPSLPGAESVRDQDLPMPPVAEAPFGLTPPPPKPAQAPTARQAPSLFERYEKLKGEEGVLILDVPAGDPTGLKRWLDRQESEHGDSPWFHRVAQALEDGNDSRAWRLAAAASARSIAQTGLSRISREEKARIQAALKGTEYARMTGRTTTIGQTEDVVKPPPVKPGQVGKGIVAGPTTGGILRPPPVRKPLNQHASDVLLGRTHIENVIARSDPALVTLLEGNRDTTYRLFRQLADQSIQGINTKEAKQYLKLSDAEIAGHFERAITESARTLAALSHWMQNNKDSIQFLRPTRSGELKFAGPGGQFMSKPPEWLREPIRIAKGRDVTPGVTPDDRTLAALAEEGLSLEKLQAIWAITQPNPQQISKFGAVENLSRAFLVSKPVTAIRNLWTQTGRYSTMILDDALAGTFATVAGDRASASARFSRAGELLKAPFRPGTVARRPWAESMQAVFDYTADRLDALPAKDTRKLLGLLESFPERAADFMGYAAGEADPTRGGVGAKTTGSGRVGKFLDDLTVDPTLRNYLTLFNRGQEYSIRATVFDATFRAQLAEQGFDAHRLLSGPLDQLRQAIPREQLDDMLGTAVWTALDATFASKPLADSIPGRLLQTFSRHPLLLRLNYPFPRFNLLAAPRFIYDHSPAALLDLIAYPFERGRLYRGTQGQQITQTFLPEVLGKRQAMELEFGKAAKDLIRTRRELTVQNRLLARAQKRGGAAGALPGTPDPIAGARAAVDSAAAAVEAAKDLLNDKRSGLADLKAQERTLKAKRAEAQQIGAPTLPDYWARMATGTLVGFGSALTIRANQRGKGTEWYEYRWDKGDGSSTLVDLRSFAPFVQYLYPADVMLDLYDHTDWDAVRREMPEGVDQVSPLNYLPAYNAIWDHYEGKYTSEKLATEFAQAFFSMSRAAGTTLTITDLMTRNGWPGPSDIGKALVGSIGQFLARFTVPLSTGKDVIGAFDAEESKARIAPDMSAQQPFGPLAAPLANVPGVSRLLPETISQTSGRPLASRSPLARQLTGVTERTRTDIEAEFKRVGVPGRTIYLPKTNDQGLDDTIARTYAGLLQEYLPDLLNDPDYQALRSPALQRDRLSKVLSAIKRGAVAQVRVELGPLTVGQQREGPEQRRTRIRQERLLKLLEDSVPQVIVDDTQEPAADQPADVPSGPPAAPLGLP